MVELTAASPFEGLLAPEPDRAAAVWAEPLACTLAGVRAGRGVTEAVIARAAERFGTAPADRLGVTGDGALAWVGTAPGAWLAVRYAGGPSLAALREALVGLAAVVDQSSGLAVLRIGGPNAADLLATGVFLDLHPSAFPPGSAASTVLAHVGVTLWRPSRELFELAIPRSFVPAVVHWLETAGSEWGLAARA